VSLFKELKRRNVIRMAGLYLVGAWLVTQVAATLLPVFGAPGWVMKVLVGLLSVGFIAAVGFSWIYDLSAQGIRRESEVPAGEAATPDTGRRMDRLLLLAMALALGYFAVDKFVLAPGRVASQEPVAATKAATAAPAPAAEAAAPAADAKPVVRGIAVLPFDNLSPDPDNAFFAGGVYEEVLTKLSRIDELRVISRTSMERIAEDNLDVRAIGERLGVSHVLEGSVRRAGDEIRVTVQLIEATTDAHVWAENYDRKLDDVFAIQSEVALAIADQLEISLSPQLQAGLSERPTQNQAAYALYLQALDERRTWRESVGFQAMIDLLEPAVAADPDFLEARVLLAEAYGRMNWLNADPDGQFAAKARQLVADIVQRWPERPQAQLAQGQLLYNLERDYTQALVHFTAARERLPNDPVLLSSLSNSYKRLGRAEEQLATQNRLHELDPESPSVNAELIQALLANRLLDEAVAVGQRARERFPQDSSVGMFWAYAELARDQDPRALLEVGSAPWQGRDLVAIARYVGGDYAALARPLPEDGRQAIGKALDLATRADLLRLAGRSDQAQPFADEALATLEVALAGPLPGNPVAQAAMNAAAASVLAMAGDAKRARRYLEQALDNLPEVDRSVVLQLSADAERRLGNPEAAWRLIEPLAGRPATLSHGELLAFRPYYDKIYGESPSYRAYVAKMGEEKE
jgi:TolB-like protein/Flp pilus assembly protein TadD